MSQEKNLDPYYQSGVAGVEHRDVDAAGSDHPFGDEPKKFEADLRQLIKQVADDLYDTWEATIREYLANAETACLKTKRHAENPEETPFDNMIVTDSYEPKITVLWDRSEKKLTIQDNGIGMAAIEVDQVFRHIGRTAARDFGAMSGVFGMGALSFSKFIGTENVMVMTSHSRLNDDNAAYLVTLAGIEPIRGSLGDSEYGTKFALDQKEDDMDVRPAVERYAKNMRVPVLYRELDESGEEVFNEDWGNERLYDSYTEGIYKDKVSVDGCFEAYMSENAENRTLLLSMDIDRNHTSENAPYPIDVRILDESGKVVKSDNGNQGLMPVSKHEYERILLEARSDYITEDLLSNQDVTAYELSHVDADYVIEKDVLESDKPLPRGDYEVMENVDEEDIVDSLKKVIMGPHKGRVVVSEDKWNDLPEGRAEMFVPESELGEGDLCLPEPTADRSKLQTHDEFWEYLSEEFTKRYNQEIEKWRKELDGSDDVVKTLKEMEMVNNVE